VKVVFHLPDQIMPLGQVKVRHVAHIAYPIQKNRGGKRPLIISRECGTLLDGHYSYTALRKFCAVYAPCIEVDYDNIDEVTAWRENELATSQNARRAASNGAILPSKTLKHLLKFPILPIRAPLGELRSDELRSTDQIDHCYQTESS